MHRKSIQLNEATYSTTVEDTMDLAGYHAPSGEYLKFSSVPISDLRGKSATVTATNGGVYTIDLAEARNEGFRFQMMTETEKWLSPTLRPTHSSGSPLRESAGQCQGLPVFVFGSADLKSHVSRVLAENSANRKTSPQNRF